jgi:hypothetical protein
MAEVRLQRYKLPELPLLKPGGNAFKYEGRIGYTGSIVRCRWGSWLNPFWHYGIIYGYDKRNTLWVIENMPQGIYAVRFLEFTKMHYYEVTEYVESPSESANIIERAKEFAQNNPVFDNLKSNCEMLVNYAHDKQNISWQVQISKWIANLILTATEINLDQSHGSKKEYIKKQIDNIRNIAEVDRPKSVDKILNQEHELH